MAGLIITEKSKIVAIADLIRAQTGSSEPMTFDQMIVAMGGNANPDTPDTPDDPDTPDVAPRLAPGIYNYDAVETFESGDIEGAAEKLHTSWADLESSEMVTVSNGVLSVNPEMELIPADEYDFVIAEGVTAIGDMGMANLGYLGDIVFPSTLTRIEEFAFAESKFWTSGSTLTIPATVNYIGFRAFENLNNLSKLIILNANADIDPEATETLQLSGCEIIIGNPESSQ